MFDDLMPCLYPADEFCNGFYVGSDKQKEHV